MAKTTGAERRRQRREAAATAKRIKESISSANAIENPLDGFEALLSVSVDAKPKGVQARSPGDVSEVPTDSSPARVSFYRSPLPSDLHDACMHAFEKNMGDFYRQSSWGLDLDEKAAELRHENARFLVVTAEGDGEPTADSTEKRDVLAFSHFRFETDDDECPTEEVLYVFEIQVSEAAQRSGLGRRLMSIMELIAMKSGMKKVMLTVFKRNKAAMDFYLTKMKYKIDESSPSNFDGEDADYEILSKSLKRPN